MSNDKPKFMPPDEVTAVYPIRSAVLEEEELKAAQGDAGDAPDAEPGADEPDPPAAPAVEPHLQPIPPDLGGPKPLVLLAFLAAGMVLASLVLLAVALGLYAIQ